MAQPVPAVLSLSAILLVVACGTVSVPTERSPGEVAFRQACRDATCDALVINLAAHPDDEAARSLVYLRRKYGLRTVTVYSTCGEGGQNRIGREIGPALARIRTRETLAAAGFTGTRVRWLGFADFGYSKTAAETFATWGKAKYIDRLTAIIDDVRPDLVLTNHTPNTGHGHHRASVISARELVVEKAKGGWVIPVYQRASRPRARGAQRQNPNRRRQRPAPDPRSLVSFEVSGFDDVTGVTYTRQAYRGWRQHRTQFTTGPFTAGRVRQDTWGLVHPAGADGTDPTVFFGTLFDEPAFRQLATIERVDIDVLREQFAAFGLAAPAAEHVARAREMLPAVRRLDAKLHDRAASPRLRRRIDALERVILAGSGVDIDATVSQERLAVGSQGFVELVVRVDPARAATISNVTAVLDGKSVPGTDGVIKIPFGPLTDVDADSAAPAWFRPEIRFDLDGLRITREIPVSYTGVPRVAIEWKRPVRFIRAGAGDRPIEADLEIGWNGDETLAAALEMKSPDGFEVHIDNASVQVPAGAGRVRRHVRIHLPRRTLTRDEAIVSQLESGTSELRLRPVKVDLPDGLFVGLIRGTDDTLQLFLQDLGIRFELLDDVALAKADLSRFTTLVLDIRAYGHRPGLRLHRDRILAWCKGGGRVVCFYHKSNEWNASDKRPLLAPYDLVVGRQRVCEEDAAVKLLDPQHRLWTYPNKIGAEDFAGWVQERGLNLPGKWDERWKPMMQMSDTGEKPLQGALLYAESGDGVYIYCALALYRQLRQGHPGAARIVVNLLAR